MPTTIALAQAARQATCWAAAAAAESDVWRSASHAAAHVLRLLREARRAQWPQRIQEACEEAVRGGGDSLAGAGRATLKVVWRHAERSARQRLAEEDTRAEGADRARLADILRDLVGNPFRHRRRLPDPGDGRLAAVAPEQPPPFDRAWLKGPGQLALALARQLAEEGKFDEVPVLGDALEEAGYTGTAVLDHLRGPGPHYRGCWVLDALLEKD